MKKYIAVVVCLAFLLGFAGKAFGTKYYWEDGFWVEDSSMDPADDAAPPLTSDETWRNPDDTAASPQKISVYVNGTPIFPDVNPYLDQNNRTMVPVRFITEALNSTVEWDSKDRQGRVQITRKSKVLKLWINDKQATVDDTTIDMDTVPVLKNNRTMVPVRFVSQAFGAEVVWSDSEKSVDITLHD